MSKATLVLHIERQGRHIAPLNVHVFFSEIISTDSTASSWGMTLVGIDGPQQQYSTVYMGAWQECDYITHFSQQRRSSLRHGWRGSDTILLRVLHFHICGRKCTARGAVGYSMDLVHTYHSPLMVYTIHFGVITAAVLLC